MKKNPFGAYTAGRADLLVIVILTAVNTFLGIIEADISFLFSAFFPQVAVVFAPYGGLFGITGTACIVLFAYIPIALYLVSWVCSKKSGAWLWVGTALFLIDTLFMFWFVFAIAEGNASFVPDIVFHVLALALLIRGAIAGSRIKSGGMKVTDKPVQTAEAFVPANRRYFRYDAAMAKQNGAKKGGAVIGLTIAFIFVILLLCVITAAIAVEIAVGILAPIIWAVFFIWFIALFVGFMFLLMRMQPYTAAPMCYAYADDDNVLCYVTNNGIIRLENMRVERVSRDHFDVTYDNQSGKRKKLVIPNAFPELAAFLTQRV